MGQNHSSAAFQNSSQPFFSRRKSSRPLPPPVALPEVTPSPVALPEVTPHPKSPTYVVAENKVLPNGVNDISAARKLLRPVSRELSKVHPEYADIFQKSQNEAPDDGSSSMVESLDVNVDNKENSSMAVNTPRTLAESKTMANGGTRHVRKQSISSDNITNLYKNTPTMYDAESDKISYQSITDSDIHQQNIDLRMTSNLLRSQSMGLSASQPVHAPKHKRQISLASNPIQEHVIPEDPREHLYNPARVVPFSNFQPSMTSLPIKSTFDLDYSLNLTYAQLAEFRRNKRTTELEERTGKKLGELEAEISASSNLPKSPFDLQNRGGKSSTHSVSTSSSDTGVSKSKKKRAPAPPQLQLATRAKEQNKINTAASEPPPDYDMHDSPSVNPLHQGAFLQRSVSSASRSSKPPAPQPLLKSSSSVSLTRPGSTGNQPILPPSNLSGSPVTVFGTGPFRGQNIDVSKDGAAIASNVLVQQSIAQARAQLGAMKKLQDMLNKPEAKKVNTANNDVSDASVNDVSNASVNDISNASVNDISNASVNDVSNASVDDVSNASVDDADDVVADLMNVVGNETARDDRNDTLNNDTILEAINVREAPQTESVKQEKHQTNQHQTKMGQPDLKQTQIHQTDADQTSTVAVTSHPMSGKHSISAADKELPRMIDPVLQQSIVLAAQARQAKYKIVEPISETHKSPRDEFLVDKANFKRTKEIAQQDYSSSNKTNLNTPQAREKKIPVLQSDVLAVITQITVSEFDKRSSTAISNQNAEFEGTSSLSSVDKFSDKSPQLENSLDQDDRSSAMSLDFSKRSSIQSEDMSISSSNASGRVFSPDWTPEHDLDSDDDIMDNTNAKAERRVSSEGFKVSVVPPKVRDLNEIPKNKSHKGSKKRNEMKEAGVSLSSDKNKFGSLRKFKKNVHQGMKNAFGSISKASGAILNKQKSQDFYDSPETESHNRSVGSDNDLSESFRNANWTLSRSIDESLHRRTLSDGFFNQRPVSMVDQSDVSDNSDDDFGDIDFAGGLNNLPVSGSSSRRTQSAGRKEMLLTRTGVAYTNSKGQIVLVPENNDANVNGHNVKDIEHFEGHTRKTHRKKEKQYAKESDSRVQEKNRVEAVLAKMIAEKEQQYEIERLRQREIESNFKRLRDLEEQELVHRLQKENKQDIINKSQQQQLILRDGHEMNNNDISVSSLTTLGTSTTGSSLTSSSLNNLNSPPARLGVNTSALLVSPLNNLGVPAGAAGIHAAFVNANGPSLPSHFLPNGNTTILPPGYLDSPINYQNTVASGFQHSYNMPSLSVAAPGQPISPIGVINANYILPFISGGGINDGFTNKTIHNLTPQELAYLGEYMRMIGVPPPANHHEWAMLLNSVSYKTSTLPIFGQNPGPITFPVAANAPDLSSVFVNKKSFDDHTSKSVFQITDVMSSQQSLHPNKLSPPQILHSNETTSVSSNHPSLNPELSQNTSSNNTVDTNAVRATKTHSQPPRDASPASAENSTKNNTTTQTITSVNEYSSLDENLTYPSTNTTTDPDSQSMSSENFLQNGQVPTRSSSRTNVLPAKVYAPLGFRPVVFNPSSR